MFEEGQTVVVDVPLQDGSTAKIRGMVLFVDEAYVSPFLPVPERGESKRKLLATVVHVVVNLDELLPLPVDTQECEVDTWDRNGDGSGLVFASVEQVQAV